MHIFIILSVSLLPIFPQVSGLSGSVFNLASSHMFGNRLNSNSAMAALIAQSEASPAGMRACVMQFLDCVCVCVCVLDVDNG